MRPEGISADQIRRRDHPAGGPPGLLAFLLYWSFVLVRPFIPMLAWSMVLTVALYPPYNWLSVHLGGRPKLAAMIITVISLAIIIGPVTWLGLGLIDGLQSLRASSVQAPWPFRCLRRASRIGRSSVSRSTTSGTMPRQISAAALRELAPHLKPLAGPVLAFAGSAGVGTLKFLLSVVLSGFLFLYGPRLVAAIRRI